MYKIRQLKTQSNNDGDDEYYQLSGLFGRYASDLSCALISINDPSDKNENADECLKHFAPSNRFHSANELGSIYVRF
jgi:hypothetical protein